MDVAVAIGPEHSDTSITVTITCEGDAYPDLRLYRELADADDGPT